MERYYIMSESVELYTGEQMAELQAFIAFNLGSTEDDYVAHEEKSHYIHTDIAIINNQTDLKAFASMGMGARALSAPEDVFKNIELLGFASPDLDVNSDKALTIAAEINAISKFPFREDTWFGPGHTIDASDEFLKAFGYEYFLFMYSGLTAEISGIGDVNHLLLIPLYEQERNATVENGDMMFLLDFCTQYGADGMAMDKPRDSLLI